MGWKSCGMLAEGEGIGRRWGRVELRARVKGRRLVGLGGVVMSF